MLGSRSARRAVTQAAAGRRTPLHLGRSTRSRTGTATQHRRDATHRPDAALRQAQTCGQRSRRSGRRSLHPGGGRLSRGSPPARCGAFVADRVFHADHGAPDRGEMPDDFDESDHGDLLGVLHQAHAGARHLVASHAEELDTRMQPAKRPRQTRAETVAGRLPRGDHDLERSAQLGTAGGRASSRSSAMVSSAKSVTRSSSDSSARRFSSCFDGRVARHDDGFAADETSRELRRSVVSVRAAGRRRRAAGMMGSP